MSKKKVNTLQVALTFAGSFLGAGFVSGQELFVYFSSYGRVGIPSMIISISLMGLISYVIFTLCMDKQIFVADDLVIRKNNKWLKGICAFIVNLLTLCVLCIMVAGIGALFNKLFGISVRLGSLIVLIVCALISYFGVTGMIKTFSLLVPFLIILAVLISISYILRPSSGTDADDFLLLANDTAGSNSPLLGSWKSSAINYCSFGLMSVLGMNTAFAGDIRDRKTCICGIVLGCFGLIFVGVCIVLAMQLSPEALHAELPMLDISFSLGSVVGYVYAILLFFGMFGNAVASEVAILNYFEYKLSIRKRFKLLLIILISVFVFFSSDIGFSNMVKIFDPVFGYIGYVILVLIFEHKWHSRIKGYDFMV